MDHEPAEGVVEPELPGRLGEPLDGTMAANGVGRDAQSSGESRGHGPRLGDRRCAAADGKCPMSPQPGGECPGAQGESADSGKPSAQGDMVKA